MKNKKDQINLPIEQIATACLIYAICFLIIGTITAFILLGKQNFFLVLLERPFESPALGLSQIIGSGLAIIYVFKRFAKKVYLNLFTLVGLGVTVGFISTLLTLFVSQILCGNIIQLLIQMPISLITMPFFMTIISIVKLGSGFDSIMCGVVSGVFLYYILKYGALGPKE